MSPDEMRRYIVALVDDAPSLTEDQLAVLRAARLPMGNLGAPSVSTSALAQLLKGNPNDDSVPKKV
jgi:hypothetical protein